jgi:hypothetical protein
MKTYKVHAVRSLVNGREVSFILRPPLPQRFEYMLQKSALNYIFGEEGEGGF